MSNPHDTSDQAPDPGGRIKRDALVGVVDRFETTVANGVLGVDQHLVPDWLCRAVVDALSVEGAAISVYLGGDIAVPVGANDLDASMGEALQFTVREGPCFESYRTRRPVLIPDVHNPDSPAWARWPIYAAQLTQHTAYRGVFAYPLLAGGVAMGSLSLYRHTSGYPQPLRDAHLIAARIADRLADELFTGPDGESGLAWLDSPTGLRRRQVWQAQGLTAQANRLTPGEAIDLLRAQAYTADRLLDDVADDIVSGRLPIPVLQSET
jgi:hypothetical protein